MARLLDAIWYRDHPLGRILLPLSLPLSWLYRSIVRLRHNAYRHGLLSRRRLPVPVIVVGNLVVGGTGKTPLAIWLARYLKRCGFKPGVICRGYGGRSGVWPLRAESDSDPMQVGDEAVLLARHCECPVWAGPDRVAAAERMIADAGCDIVISDDGLQHLALARDVEIAVIDGARRTGNGRCLPAGPLREPLARLAAVDLIVAKGDAHPGEFEMRLAAGAPKRVSPPHCEGSFEDFAGLTVHAVCGIGHPEAFFEQLRIAGVDVEAHAFADHHPFTASDIDFGEGGVVLMTEKDAVKCETFAGSEQWFVPVAANPDPALGERILELLGRRTDGQEAARDPGLPDV